MRPIVLGNQRMLVNCDAHGFVRDIYYKRVGQENHVLGHPHRMGVWAEFSMSWLDEPEWTATTVAEGTLVMTTTVRNEKRDITITFQDVVLKDHDVLIRRITSNRHVRLFVYHYFFLYGDGIGDTAGYDPIRSIIFHYKRNRYFGIGVYDAKTSVLADYTVATPHEGQEAWRDALDGELGKNPIAQGNVDSCIAFNVLEGQTVDYVLSCARNFPQMRTLVERMANANRSGLIAQTAVADRMYSAPPAEVRRLKPEWQHLYSQSILIVRAHCDAGGAIVAGADSENMLFNRDTYTYAWGRDNAIIANALDRAGKHDLTRAYFAWMREVIEPEGYYMHKHHPDGSLGSSWQAWVRDGKSYLPIQEDETALQLWALKQHHESIGDDSVLQHYEWITKMTDFLCSYVRDDMALPQESWDLWEERQGIHTWTVASVIAGLQAGAFFAHLRDDEGRASVCTDLAKRMTDAMRTSLSSSEHGRFIRRLTPTLEPDLTVDAADLAPFLFGILPHDDPLVIGTARTIEKELTTPDGGIARYQGDYFHRKTEDSPGNAWTMCTLWLASWYAARGDRARSEAYIDWVVAHQVGGGVIGEQFHPVTGEPLAVCPLTWAHAQFLIAVHDFIEAFERP